MMRFFANGPRSLRRTTTLLPLLRLVTRAYAGSGSVLCAAVMPYMSYDSPMDVLSPWKVGPYQDATPRSTKPSAESSTT